MSYDTEIDALSAQISELKARRAELLKTRAPEPISNYTFQTGSGEVSLADLFGDRETLLIIHNMGPSCPYCTLWADGLNGSVRALESASAFVVVNHESPDAQRSFADSRGWKFRMASAARNSFSQDMGFKQEDGLWPGVSAFKRDLDGNIVRTGRAFFGPGDDFCPTWPMLELLGMGDDDWAPEN